MSVVLIPGFKQVVFYSNFAFKQLLPADEETVNKKVDAAVYVVELLVYVQLIVT